MKSWKTNTRQMCRTLEAWWGTEKNSFRPTPMSGAWDAKKAAADIIAPDDFPFCVEMKTEQSWDFRLALNSDSNRIYKYTQQVYKDAGISRKMPILIITKKYYPMYLGVPVAFANVLLKSLDKPISSLTIRAKDYGWTFFQFCGSDMKADKSEFMYKVKKENMLKAHDETLENVLNQVDKFNGKRVKSKQRSCRSNSA